MIKISLTFFLTLVTLAPAHGFGDLGHKMVAAIAWQRLTPSAKQNVQRILGAGKKSFVNASVWADHIKGNRHFNYLKPMHYVNMPKDARLYERRRDCRKDQCVVQAIETFSQRLASRQAQNKKLALRMVIHLLADIHQPLHAGLRADRGGNLYQVRYQGKPLSLHKLWDHHLVKRLNLGWRESHRLMRHTPKFELATPAVWAQESHQITVHSVYRVKENGVVSGEYLSLADEIVRRRIQQGGWRLAMWLNKIWSLQ